MATICLKASVGCVHVNTKGGMNCVSARVIPIAEGFMKDCNGFMTVAGNSHRHSPLVLMRFAETMLSKRAMPKI